MILSEKFATFRDHAFERIPFEWSGLRSASFWAAHGLFGKPLSTFPEHAPITCFVA
jgi:hypothetical protein